MYIDDRNDIENSNIYPVEDILPRNFGGVIIIKDIISDKKSEIPFSIGNFPEENMIPFSEYFLYIQLNYPEY